MKLIEGQRHVDSQDHLGDALNNGIKPKRASQVYESHQPDNENRSPYYDNNTKVDLEDIQNYNRSRERYDGEDGLVG